MTTLTNVAPVTGTPATGGTPVRYGHELNNLGKPVTVGSIVDDKLRPHQLQRLRTWPAKFGHERVGALHQGRRGHSDHDQHGHGERDAR